MRRKPVWQLCLSLISLSIFIVSCQKDADPTLPPGSTVSSDNPAQLSAALRVWHGKRTTGNPPASTGSIPALDPTINMEVRAFAGRYAIIKPEVMAGEIAGYYVSIAGSGQYFKVDFTNPRNMEGRPTIPPGRRNSIFSRPQSGNADSSIVIVLPPNIQVPDTFCVTYCAYDSQGNIGQPITTCIIVSSLGGDANSAWLQNEWRLRAAWEMVNGQREFVDTIVYNKWWPNGGYECYVDSNGVGTINWVGWGITANIVVNDSLYYRKSNLRFATNGAMDYKDDVDEKYLNELLSTCTQFVFYPVENWSDSITGAWSFNSSTNKMVLIFEFDSSGYPDPEVWEYNVIKVSDTHWILKDPWDDYYYRWQR